MQSEGGPGAGLPGLMRQALDGFRGAEVDPEPSLENGGWIGKGRRTRSLRGESMEREAEKRRTMEEVGSREGEAPGEKPLEREEEFAWLQCLSPSRPQEVQYLQALFRVGFL